MLTDGFHAIYPSQEYTNIFEAARRHQNLIKNNCILPLLYRFGLPDKIRLNLRLYELARVFTKTPECNRSSPKQYEYSRRRPKITDVIRILTKSTGYCRNCLISHFLRNLVIFHICVAIKLRFSGYQVQNFILPLKSSFDKENVLAFLKR